MQQPSTLGLYSLLLGQHPTMDHRAYKTLHMLLAVPGGFTVEQVGDNPTTPANPPDWGDTDAHHGAVQVHYNHCHIGAR